MDDVIATSELAGKVYTAYKDAPDNYSHISEEVAALQVLINDLKRTTISSNDSNDGQEILEGCQSVLWDLNSLIEKYKIYKSLASTNMGPVPRKVKLGAEDIETLGARLASNTALLSSFIQRFDISPITS